jgi:hypothetical protein
MIGKLMPYRREHSPLGRALRDILECDIKGCEQTSGFQSGRGDVEVTVQTVVIGEA